ncbi:hypothetical protein [Geodermatophilus marinus]|uniref:hypothetical protein n=1 Tax=Geodermatophilus sp. LHW52908 TaxID=2303986 RepID=UPI000E3D83A3|nr:hypothetical protein [Geodermatophilus sp. LHW52908]RFU18824.1 hypothetical protein D0Z06_24540 [Geodermatophilus sp. LHW52908]
MNGRTLMWPSGKLVIHAEDEVRTLHRDQRLQHDTAAGTVDLGAAHEVIAQVHAAKLLKPAGRRGHWRLTLSWPELMAHIAATFEDHMREHATDPQDQP